MLTIIGDLYTPAERGRVQGLFGAVWGIAGIAGPLLGAALVHSVSWRWVFLVNIPPGVLSFAVLIGAYREEARSKATAPLDVLGAAAITAAALALLLAASQVLPWAMVAAAAVFAWVFVWIERRAADPVLPLSLLSRRLIAVTTIASALFGAAMMGVLTFLPVHVQGVLGRAPVIAGSDHRAHAGRLAGGVGHHQPHPGAHRVSHAGVDRLGGHRRGLGGPGLDDRRRCRAGAASGWRCASSAWAWACRSRPSSSACRPASAGSSEAWPRPPTCSRAPWAAPWAWAPWGAVLALRIGRTLPADVVGALLDPHRREEALRYPGVVDALGDALDPLFWAGGVVAVLGLLVVLAHPRDKRQPSEPVAPIVVAE